MKTIMRFVLWWGLGVACFGQAAAPMPQPEWQVLDNSGLPLAAGKLCTYLANTSIALSTYVDSTGTTANTNPVTLDSAGRASIWGVTTGQRYKIVLRSGGTAYPAADACTTGTVLWSQDNITVPSVGGGGVFNSLYVLQTGSGSSGNGGYIDLPLITYPSTTCLDVYGNVVNQPVITPGSAAFGASDVVLWNSPSPLAGASPPGCATAFTVQTVSGLNLNTYLFAMGGLATSNAQYNSIQSLSGGAYVKLGYTADQALYVKNHAACAGLNTPAAGYGGWSHSSGSVYCYYNDTTAAWVTVDLSAGGGGGTPGGATTQVQYNSSGAFAGSANFTFASQLLTVTASGAGVAGIAVATGFAQADQGFIATSGTCLNYNCIQAPTGGVAARSVTASKYAQVGSSAGVPTVTASDTFNPGAMYFDTGTHKLNYFNDSAAWVAVTAGSTSPGGANTQVQFNSTGSFGGSANFTFASQLLTVTASGSGAAGMAVATGYMQADAGFLATSGTCNLWNCFQAPTGGHSGKNFTATAYVQTGHQAGTPTVTSGDTFHAGALSYDDTAGCEKFYNGSSWACLSAGAGGVSTLNGLSGAVTLAGTAGQIILTPSGNTITYSAPQSLATNSNFQVGTLAAATTVQSSSTGATISFQVANNSFLVDGQGNVSATKVFAATGATAGFNITTNTSGNSFQTVGGITAGSASTFNGGVIIPVGTNSTIVTGSSGNFYTRPFSGGAPSCAGVADGWLAINTTNQEIYVCIGSVAYHTVALTTP